MDGVNVYAELNKKKKLGYKVFKLASLTRDEVQRYIGILLMLSISLVHSYRQAWNPNSSQVSVYTFYVRLLSQHQTCQHHTIFELFSVLGLQLSNIQQS